MAMFRRFVIAGVFSLGLASTGLAQDDMPAALRRCSSITEDLTRLACFDAVARSVAPAAPSSGEARGAWDIQTRPGSVVASQRPAGPPSEDDISLVVGCTGGVTSVSVRRQPVVARSASTLVTVHVNDRLLDSDLWATSADLRSASMPGDAAAFLRGLPSEGELMIRLEGSRGFRFEGTFALRGLDQVRRAVGQACRWP